MAWRGLHVSRPAALRLAHRRLEVEQEGAVRRFPLEDVAWVVLDTPQVTMTAALLSACAEAGVPVLVVDAQHLPCGVLLPFHQHFRQAEVARAQMALTAAARRRLWTRIVIAKIGNQAEALATVDWAAGRVLGRMADQVRPGDPANVEARAARYYWGRFFAGFLRGDEADVRNAMLNYAYAVLRAAIARALVAAGLLPAFGLHHAGVQNAFNLADDMLEPFRPFADRLARTLWDETGGRDPRAELTLTDRRALAAILHGDAGLGAERMAMLTAIEAATAALVRAMRSGDPADLSLPTLLAPAAAESAEPADAEA
jgi:CRISPR-associated protein Cas1